MKSLFLVLTSLSFFLACESAQTNVTFSVQVSTNKGDKVEGAKILLNDQEIGVTDANGQWTSLTQLPMRSRQKIEIVKDSEKFYYARYVDSFQVKESATQDVKLNATLYFAPKPSNDEAVAVSENDMEKVTELVAKKEEKPAEEIMKDPHDLVKEQLAETHKPEDKPAELPALPKSTEEVIKLAAKAPQPEEVKLTPVEKAPKVETKHFEQIKSRKPTGVEITYTVHVYSGQKPLSGAQVFFGSKHATSLDKGCKTNVRGRCIIRFKNNLGETVALLAKKEGYKSARQMVRVKQKGITRFNLQRGETIDIFAYQKTYNNISGVPEVHVLIDGKRVGSTDRFGHFSYVHTGQRSDLVQVSLRTKSALPESYDTDFVVAGPMSLVRYYTPQTPPPVKMTLTSVQPGGRLSPAQMRAFNGSLDRMIRAAANKSLFSLTAYKKYSFELFKSGASRSGRTLSQMIKKGWVATDLKSQVDVVIVPTLVFNKSKNMTLEVSMVDSRGKVVAAAKEILDSLKDSAAIEQAMRGISEKLTRIYAFEGAVVGKEDEDVLINLGYSSGRGVRKGDRLTVYGIQSDKMGQKQNFDEIATLKVVKVEDRQSRARIIKQKPRSLVQQGDLVVLHTRKHKNTKQAQIRVVARGQGGKTQSIEQANVYFNGAWLGSSDDDGRLYLDRSSFNRKGLLKVLKYGYRDFTREVNLGNRKVFEVRLTREMAFVRIHSEPKNAKVYIDNELVGNTPIYKPIPVPSGFMKVKIEAPNGYKNYENVLELERGTLDLTGANKVELEKDYRTLAMKRLKAGEYQAAIKRLRQVPRGHSDYLQANHEIGEIYLTKLRNPAKAAEAFSRVTSDQGVSQFADKRFVGTHINEGIALFMTAERLKNQQQATSQAHYLKAIEKLDQVEPQMRFVSKNQYEQASHNIGYYRAMSYQNLWYQTKDEGYLGQAYKYWRDYLADISDKDRTNPQFKKLVANAEVLYKQAKATLDSQSKSEKAH